MVQTRADGTCFCYVPRDYKCPKQIRCNPPPPQDIDVRCPVK